ncbi:hypothetical protein [Actinomadura parmotrematis]|uniref:Uncharacterized protein n=1 Tax=Actinomadura parmotrematis TaxID=2864039 RepID=A0ABS7FRX7_9ACTN|nr:hypothetical protein [Actinomadura parmotrematis]MBW8482307.1 hypothetical protein [Actinomadura parmotrematis]
MSASVTYFAAAGDGAPARDALEYEDFDPGEAALDVAAVAAILAGLAGLARRAEREALQVYCRWRPDVR